MTNDVISRTQAIDALEKEYRCTDQSDDWGGLKTAMLIIENMPPAQPERKKGCKIVKGTGTYGYCACDQCGKPVHPEDKFCSNCGADFREDT